MFEIKKKVLEMTKEAYTLPGSVLYLPFVFIIYGSLYLKHIEHFKPAYRFVFESFRTWHRLPSVCESKLIQYHP